MLSKIQFIHFLLRGKVAWKAEQNLYANMFANLYLSYWGHITNLHKGSAKSLWQYICRFILILLEAHRKVALCQVLVSSNDTLTLFPTLPDFQYFVAPNWKILVERMIFVQHFFKYIVWVFFDFNPTLILSQFCKFETRCLNLKPLYHLWAKASVDGGNGARFKLWSFLPQD